jgi:hypothetical protein
MNQQLRVSTTISALALLCASGAQCVANGTSVYHRYVISAPDPDLNSVFGRTTVMNDQYLVVADADESVDGRRHGAVRIYERDTGAFVRFISPFSVFSRANFGASMAISGDLLIIGAPLEQNQFERRGSVYIYNIHTGQFIEEIIPADSGLYSYVGRSLDVDGNTLAIGADHEMNDNGSEGAVYLYDLTTFEQIRKIEAPAGTEYIFGKDVAIENGLVAIGAHRYNDEQGAVYLHDAQTGELVHLLTETDTHQFGISVDMEDGLLAVGSYAFEGGLSAAAVYDTATFERLNVFSPANEDLATYFSEYLEIEGGLLFVSARGADVPSYDFGAMFAYDLLTAQLTHQFIPESTNSNEEFGYGFSVYENYLAVGSNDFQVNDEGRATVFRLPDPACLADLNCDARLDFFDVSQFLLEFVSNQPRADFNNDGAWDFFDASIFLTSYLNGCP